MRRKNWRIVVVGAVLIVIAIAFYLVMLSMAAKSNDPKALMQIVGQAAGAVCGLSIAMITAGLIGKKE